MYSKIGNIKIINAFTLLNLKWQIWRVATVRPLLSYLVSHVHTWFAYEVRNDSRSDLDLVTYTRLCKEVVTQNIRLQFPVFLVFSINLTIFINFLFILVFSDKFYLFLWKSIEEYHNEFIVGTEKSSSVVSRVKELSYSVILTNLHYHQNVLSCEHI